MYALSQSAPLAIDVRLSCQRCAAAWLVSPTGIAGVMFNFLARSCPALRSEWWSRIIMRPNSLTSARVPFCAATLPAALSAAFAASSMATMLVSLSAGGAGGGGGAAAAAARAALSAAAIESAVLSFFEHATHSVHAPSSARPRAWRIDIRSSEQVETPGVLRGWPAQRWQVL